MQQRLWQDLDDCRCKRLQAARCPAHPLPRLRETGTERQLFVARNHIQAAWSSIGQMRVRPDEPMLVALAHALEEVDRYRAMVRRSFDLRRRIAEGAQRRRSEWLYRKGLRWNYGARQPYFWVAPDRSSRWRT